MPVSAITVHTTSSDLLVHLSGEIDISLQDQADAALAEVVTSALPVVVDLGEVRLLGAPGLAFLVRCEHVCAQLGLPYVVRNTPPHVARLLAALELDGLLRHDESRRRVSS